MAIQRISQGVDESMVGVLREAGEQLNALLSEQNNSLISWQSSSKTMQNTVQNLVQVYRHSQNHIQVRWVFL